MADPRRRRSSLGVADITGTAAVAVLLVLPVLVAVAAAFAFFARYPRSPVDESIGRVARWQQAERAAAQR